MKCEFESHRACVSLLYSKENVKKVLELQVRVLPGSQRIDILSTKKQIETCRKKVPYSTKKIAYRSLKWLKRHRVGYNSHIVYKCDVCAGYHLATDRGTYRWVLEK